MSKAEELAKLFELKKQEILTVALIVVAMALSACGKFETKQELIPEICLGTFTRQTPAYSMRDADGNLIQFNERTADVPAIDNMVVISKDSVKLTQKADGKSIKGEGKARLIHANPKEILIEAEVFDQSNSHPTYQISYDTVGGSITMSQTGLKAKTPDTFLRRASSK